MCLHVTKTAFEEGENGGSKTSSPKAQKSHKSLLLHSVG